MLQLMYDSSMSAQGEPRGSGLVLVIFFLGLQNKNHKRDLMRPFSKHCLNLAWPGIMNPCQGQCLHLGKEINSRKIIIHRHWETCLK